MMTYDEAITFMKVHKDRIIDEARHEGLAREVVMLYGMRAGGPSAPLGRRVLAEAVEELKTQWGIADE